MRSTQRALRVSRRPTQTAATRPTKQRLDTGDERGATAPLGGRPLTRTDALGHRLGYSWDRAGRLSTLTNENGAQTRFHYDLRDRLIAETGFDGKRTTYHYNAAGELIEKREAPDTPNAVRTVFARDALGRLTHKTAADGHAAQRTEYRYDATGQLVLARNQDSRIEFGYDPRGLLRFERRIALGRDETLLHELDALGNRIATRLPDGRTVNWLHYGAGHLHQVNVDGEVICDIERDALHREISRTQGALASHYQLDAEGRLLHQRAARSGKTAPLAGALSIERRYAYDPAGQLLGIDDRRRGRTRYAYDPLGRRIAKLDGQGKPKQLFLWDGNRLLMEAKCSTDTETSRLYLYEPESFTPMALVDAVTTPAEAAQVTTTVVRAQLTNDEDDDFAAELQRAKASLNQPPKAQLTATRALGEATNQLSPAERQGVRPNPKPTVQRILYYHCDHLGTPQELTDREGNIVWAADYAAWGKVRKIERPGPRPRAPRATGGFGGLGAAGLGASGLSHSSPANFPTQGNAALRPVFEDDTAANEAVFAEPVEQHLRFQGQYFDAETGLHYNRFRYYDPDCGRFVSLDPMGLDGGTNLFQYVANPTGWVDPLGLAASSTSGNSTQAQQGQVFHNDMQKYPYPEGYKREQPVGSAGRADAINYEDCSMIERKCTCSPRTIKKGEKQLERYCDEMKKRTGQDHEGILDILDPKTGQRTTRVVVSKP